LKWRLYDPHFQAELNARRQALFSSSADRLRALIPVALDVIEEELVNTPPGSGRAQIALALIKMLQIPVGAIGPTDPEAVLEQAARDRSSSPMIREWRAGPAGQQEELRVWLEAIEEVGRRHQKEGTDSRVWAVRRRDRHLIVKPAEVSLIRFGLQCNADGQLSAANDVFDYAELCWGLAQEGWTGEQIAYELGEKWSPPKVTYYSNIRRLLCPRAWDMARHGLTRNDDSVNAEDEDVVNQWLTKVHWNERHFRALLAYLGCQEIDRATMRAQVKAIFEILARFAAPDKKVTAKWIEDVAQRHAWHTKLAKYMSRPSTKTSSGWWRTKRAWRSSPRPWAPWTNGCWGCETTLARVS
jgi:hypothetical protein